MVDYTEFITAAANKQKLLNEQNLKFAFDAIDLSHDGSISREELKQRFNILKSHEDKLWDQIFREVDMNRDDKITYDEFKSSMENIMKH